MDKYVNLKTKLQLCKNSNIKYIQKNEIDEINNVSIDTNLPKVDRIMNFLDKAKNPYMFIINGMKVKMEVAPAGKNINECFETLIMNRKNV